MMDKSERICKRPTMAKTRQALSNARVLEALEREEAGMGIKHPDHLRKLKEKLKGAKA